MTNDFRDGIRSALKRSGRTQQDLATRLGKSAAYVSQVLSPGRNATVATMAEMATALDLEIHIVLRRKPTGTIVDWSDTSDVNEETWCAA